MNSAANVLDPTGLPFAGDFDTQVYDILDHIKLTEDEVNNLGKLFSDLEMALQNMKPGAQVWPFGSIVTGLGIKTSDVDCFISLPPGGYPNKNYIIYARNVLRQYYQKFTNLIPITTAKVPIVKFLHIPTNFNCDINFSSPAGVHNSELISFFFKLDPTGRTLHLALLIKYWSKVHKFTGTNLLASYALTLMVIFYLQLMNVLPSVVEMQSSVPAYFVDCWNIAFDMTTENYNCKTYDLYDLVGGFFKCYANMNFEENIISPYMGRLLNKKLFKNGIMATEFTLYEKNIAHKMCKQLNTNAVICVQDPFDHARNTTVAVFPQLASRIKAHFQFAAKKFDELPPECFLKAIFMEDTTKEIPYIKKKVKHLSQNKVMKVKHNPPQRQNPGHLSLIKCYEKIKAMRKSK